MKQVNMLNGPIWKSVVRFSIPVFLTYLIQLLYYTTDTIFVGRFLGTNAQAAVGAGGSLITLIIGLLGGITTGVSVLISRYFGAKDQNGLTVATTSAASLAILFSVLLAFLGVLFCPTYLRLVHTPEEIFPEAVAYLRVYCLSIPAMVLYNTGLGMLRAIGDSFRPMLFQILGGLFNVVFDALFLVLLRMEAVGSAWGTLAAQSIVAAVVIFYVLRQKETFRIRRLPMETLLPDVRKILSVGLPAGFQAMLITLSNVLIQSEINRFGAVAIAAFAVYFEVELIIYYPIVAFGQAASVFVGQNMGAAQKERAHRGVLVTMAICLGVTVLTTIVSILFSPQLFSIFSKDQSVIDFGLKIVKITFPFYFIYVFLQVLGDALRAMSYSFSVMLIVLLNIGLLRVLLMYGLVYSFGTVQAMVTVYPITWFTAAVSMAVLYMVKTKNIKKGESIYEKQTA